MGIKITLERYDVQVLGRKFQYEGKMEPVGRLLDYLNSAGRSTFPLFDVKILSMGPGGVLKGTVRPEITVSVTELGILYFADSAFRERIQVLRNVDRVIVYTPHAVLRGNFHRGAETKLGDIFDVMQGSYLAMTDVNIFPISTLPAAFPQYVDLLIVNRHYADMYHPD